MRTIKFRGRDERGCWHIGWLAETNDGTIYIAENDEGWTDDGFHNDDFSGWYKVLEKTVGQFVIKTPKDQHKYDGFYDLYEDDIVQARESFIYYNSVYPFTCNIGDKFVLSHYDAGFCLVPIKTYNYWIKNERSPIMGGIIDNYELWNLHRKFVPIGNIHDNKQLLKKE